MEPEDPEGDIISGDGCSRSNRLHRSYALCKLIPFALFRLRCSLYGCIPGNPPYRLAAFGLLPPSGCRLISLLTMPAYTNLCVGACNSDLKDLRKYTTLPMAIQQWLSRASRQSSKIEAGCIKPVCAYYGCIHAIGEGSQVVS